MVAKKTAKKSVIVRAYSGVFFGLESQRRGDEIDLLDCRQIWQWQSTGLEKPVLTCGDIAIRGVGKGSKVSDPSPLATIRDVKAVFVCTPEAVRVIEGIA
jgi:hypothetical protein